MRFDIAITAKDEPRGWLVEVHTGEAALVATRLLRHCAATPLPFPLPPESELDGIEAQSDPIHYALCAATDGSLLHTTLQALIMRNPEVRGVEQFGRYLFCTLLGDALWQEIRSIAGTHPIELAIGWGANDRALNRLPWEVLHNGNLFLAQEPGVAITRRVPGAVATLKQLDGVPRVLFVVGSELGNDVINPGAEYLGLLRSLRDSHADLSLNSHLLLNATPRKLRSAMRWFAPEVVHFICHGDWDSEGRFFLSLIDDDRPGAVSALRAQHLKEDIFAGTMPKVVVLNACFSASSGDGYHVRSDQLQHPLTVDLVQMGVAVVVGMAGEVSDQACRLFSRRFYEALLRGEPIAEAAAQGRRAGILGGGEDPRSSTDWSLPVLFLAHDLAFPHLTIPDAAVQGARKLEQIAKHYATPTDYPVFCDRLRLLQWYDLLMADGAMQSATSPRGREFQMLAVTVNQVDPPKGVPGSRFGRTWLLHELAARMVRDGHIPCLVTEDGSPLGKAPNTEAELWQAVRLAAIDTANRFGVGTRWRWSTMAALAERVSNNAPGVPLPVELESVVQEVSATHPWAKAIAFRHDLLALRDMILDYWRPAVPERCRLVLLIDDVHRFGTAAEYLTETLLGSNGLRAAAAAEHIRVVATYASRPAPGQEHAVGKIQTWVASSWVEDQELAAFEPPEDRLAYRHFLLRYRENNAKGGNLRPLALASGLSPKLIDLIFRKLTRATDGGTPSHLAGPRVHNEIDEILIDWPEVGLSPKAALRYANDEDALRLLTQATGPARP